MKKLVILSLALVLTACGTDKAESQAVESPATKTTNEDVKAPEKETTTETEEETTAVDFMNAKAMVNRFKESGLSVGTVVVYDEKTDPNKLLNRPNQYIQKISFEDTSIEQPDPKFLLEGEQPFKGGTIEVFPNKELAKSRKEYVEMVTKDVPMIQQYIYVNGTAVLRLEYDVLPSDAKKYKNLFMSN